jgi:stage II sporulation protein GA (sporulation sigma-E factor processing peptidase)
VRTVYIDVYFLINFTVDLLALHLASLFVKVRVKNARLILAALLSALYACVSLFLEIHVWILAAISIFVMLIVAFVIVSGISLSRRFKLMVSFLLFLTVIGGIVYLVFNVIDSYFPDQLATTVENRRLLTLSILILLAIGVIRLFFVFFFNSTSERVVHLKIELLGRAIECDALVDSGNLLKDPIDLTPVMLIKADCVCGLFPYGIPSADSRNFEALERYVRFIPINKDGKSDLKLGIRAERVQLINGTKREEIKLTFVIDKEEGRYGGYEALIPSSALENT